MTSVRLCPHWQIGPDAGGLSAGLFPLRVRLEAMRDGGGIAPVVCALGWSHHHAWGFLRQGEALLGRPLLERGLGCLPQPRSRLAGV